MFVYKKTIFDINNEYRKNMVINNNNNYLDYFDILHIYNNIIKSIISFLTHKCKFLNDNKITEMNNILNNSEPIFDKICNLKFNKNAYNIILTFIEQLNKDITSEKYIKIIELFLKKFHKSKVVEIKLAEKIYHSEFDEILEDTPEKFISWLFI